MNHKERKAFRHDLRSQWRKQVEDEWKDHTNGNYHKRFHHRSPFYSLDNRHRPGWLFARFVISFGLLAIFLLGGIGIIGYLITGIFNLETTTNQVVWLMGLLFLIINIFIIVWLSRKAFSRITNPLSEIMSAAEAVSHGDFSVQVSTEAAGEFSDLTEAFNKMVRELERAENQRRNLTADVAHELRTPLQIIQGNLEGVIDGIYEPDQNTISAILEETHLLTRLVEDLRTLSLAESGQLSLNMEKIDLIDLVEDIATNFSSIAEAGDVKLSVRIDPVLREAQKRIVEGDLDRLNQVVGNLVSNAIRHTHSGGEVNIGLNLSKERIEIIVEDNGEGISNKELPYIFDRFWKGDRSRSHANGTGSGLGLAISKQLIEAHGGDITVSSYEGKGTRFTICL